MEAQDWAGVYKLLRLAILALALAGIAIWLFLRRNKERLEEPARRMLEEEDER
jgi:cbb3-type cytochrome oxidase subunit 3